MAKLSRLIAVVCLIGAIGCVLLLTLVLAIGGGILAGIGGFVVVLGLVRFGVWWLEGDARRAKTPDV